MNGNDGVELVKAVKEGKKLEKYKEALYKHRIIIVVLVFVIVFQIILLINQSRQFSFYQNSYKLNYLSVYNVEQTLTMKDRKKKVMHDIMKVALQYYPKWDEKKLSQLAEFIYEKGETVYNVPAEEWIILFTLESEWNPNAVSTSGAKGLGQLMPVISMYNAEVLGISWRGDKTLFDPIDNVKISMRYYFDLRKQYEKPEYFITAYYWGEREVGYFYRYKKKLKGKYLDYLERYIKIKEKVEKILNRKIFIENLKDDEYQ